MKNNLDNNQHRQQQHRKEKHYLFGALVWGNLPKSAQEKGSVVENL